MKKNILLASTLLVFACKSKTVVNNLPKETIVKNNFPVTSLAPISAGQRNYETYCGSCHELKSPNSENIEGWNKIVPIMVRKTNENAGREVIDLNMKDEILAYLVSKSQVK